MIISESLARIFMFLPIFVVSTDDVVVPAAATMHKRGGCIDDCCPAGFFPAVVRSILRLQDA